MSPASAIELAEYFDFSAESKVAYLSGVIDSVSDSNDAIGTNCAESYLESGDLDGDLSAFSSKKWAGRSASTIVAFLLEQQCSYFGEEEAEEEEEEEEEE